VDRDDEAIIITHWRGTTERGIEWNVHAGDAYNVLQVIPSNSVNCVVTSPPYFWLRDYGVEAQIGMEDTIHEYVQSIARIMDEVRRVLTPNGVLFLNIGDTYYSGKGESQGNDRKSSKRRFGLRAVDRSGGMGIGLQPKTLIGIPWRVVNEMTERRWVLRSSIIWHRQHALPESVNDRPRRSYEFVFMFSKSKRYYFNRQPLIDADVEDMWTIAARPQPTNGISTAPFPDELVERCLAIGCPLDGTVMDPFAGSGTTLRVALLSGRPATGIDLNPAFCDFMVTRLREM
jgi:DNA modification methylase